MVMEESAMHPHHESHSPSGGDAANANSNTNVYLVGLEFVRQYYTVLNQGPLYLHRFYSDDSSFVHGASARDSKVAYGQQEIHKRIQSLNFHNCHAKIRQVDSHETLGNGVAIQVTGELSNNGQPMRRFMQTFVLAPQSPKRYYVRNDIFHYQDEVFCDEDGDGDDPVESGMENEDGDDHHHHEPIAVVEINGGSDIIPRVEMPGVEVSVKMSQSPRSAPPPQKTSSNEQQDESSIISPIISIPSSDPVVTVSADGGSGSTSEIITPSGGVGISVVGNSTSSPAQNNEDESSSAININNANISSAPKTYANLFKVPAAPLQQNTATTATNKPTGGPPPSGSGGVGGNKFPPTQNNPSSSSANKGGSNNGPGRAGSPGNSQFSVNTNDNTTSPPQISPQSGNASGGAVKGLPPRRGGYGGRDSRDRDNNRPPMDKDRRERLTSRSSTTLNDETGSVDGDRRRPVHTYPDANQLFVGNLPHFVTVQDMKDIFQQFGDVAEVKIQKPTPKSGGMKVPYFCFVVFEEPASALAAIERKSEIFMKMNGGGQRRLNVEQKRSQRSGRLDSEHNDGPYNRMDSSSPAGGNREGGGGGMPRGSRTFRGSNRGGGPGGDRDRNNDRGGGHNMGRGGGGNMNSGRGGGGMQGGGNNTGRGGGNNNNKP